MSYGSIIIPRDKLAQLAGDIELKGLFVELVEKAQFKRGFGPDGMPLECGQLVTGKRHLAALTGRTASKCYRALKSLQKRNMIELETNRQGTVVTIVDWPRYARLPKSERTKVEPRSDQSRTTSEPKVNHKRTPKKAEGRKKEPPPTPSPSTEAAASTWQQVEEELLDCGVSAATAAVRGAAARPDFGPADALRRIAEFRARPGAYQPGALYRIVIGDLADWPPIAEGYRRPEARELIDERKRLLGLRADLESQWGTKFRKLPNESKRLLLKPIDSKFPDIGTAAREAAAMELLASDPERWAATLQESPA